MSTPIRLLPDGNPETGFVPSSLVAESDFTTEDKTETISSFFESQDGKISTGVWECAPCREIIEAYPVDEMMTVIAGSVTLTASDGSAQTFGAGDTFFIPKGTPCTWEITQTLRKFYMIAA
ncbi:Ethanolamine utilization protein [Ruegeria denitrificans]|uniref:Ethanolamine utilization protein n=1 Tax=Ruegeria denitrificans TaxID=1715692 RepID=A0A0P1IIF2_9RHOB|nr:cupin domain-containing protein [Ruegeria denitrificans]CUK03256.1 Ethanolamine utilization protein [Ruegeria denitrificans]